MLKLTDEASKSNKDTADASIPTHSHNNHDSTDNLTSKSNHSATDSHANSLVSTLISNLNADTASGYSALSDTGGVNKASKVINSPPAALTVVHAYCGPDASNEHEMYGMGEQDDNLSIM